MKVVYIAGPFRAMNERGEVDAWGIHCNVVRAMDVALQVWKSGAAAVCPHSNTIFFQGAAPDNVWLDGDLAILAKADAILMTPDWERSSGARAELAFALGRNIPAFYTLDALRAWVSHDLDRNPSAVNQ